MKIVVLSPHRDDAAFSLGLAIEHWLRQGHRVTVLNCFTESEYAPYSDVDLVHPHDRPSFVSAVRRREDLAWSKLLGKGLQFHDLTLMDAPLRLACPVEDVLHVEVRAGDRALARVRGAMEKLGKGQPAGTIAFAVPLALGGHIDHRIAHQAALEVLTTSEVPLAFYEDLPYAAWPGVEETIPAAVSQLQRDLQPVFAEEPAADVAAQSRRKFRMAECYDSQVDSAVVQTMAEYAAHLGGRERQWANAAWCSSALAVPAL